MSASGQILAAARLLALSWGCSLQVWLLPLDTNSFVLGLVGIDIALSVIFLLMSRRRWFPAPLFFIHFGLVCAHIYFLIAPVTRFWVSLFINRAFDVALLYVLWCAIYRIRVRRRSAV